MPDYTASLERDRRGLQTDGRPTEVGIAEKSGDRLDDIANVVLAEVDDGTAEDHLQGPESCSPSLKQLNQSVASSLVLELLEPLQEFSQVRARSKPRILVIPRPHRGPLRLVDDGLHVGWGRTAVPLLGHGLPEAFAKRARSLIAERLRDLRTGTLNPPQSPAALLTELVVKD